MPKCLDTPETDRPIDVEAALTDAELEAGGLEPIRGWVRRPSTKNALRVRRHKEKRASDGVRQVNLMAPEGAHGALRALAAAERARPGRAEQARAVVEVMERGGWRGRLLGWLAKVR